jgi:hypothetical protein
MIIIIIIIIMYICYDWLLCICLFIILLIMISFCYHKVLIFYVITLLTLRHSPTPTFSQPPPAASLPPTPQSAWPTAGRSASPRAATSRACRAARDRARKQRRGGRDATPRVGAVGLVLLGGMAWGCCEIWQFDVAMMVKYWGLGSLMWAHRKTPCLKGLNGWVSVGNGATRCYCY